MRVAGQTERNIPANSV